MCFFFFKQKTAYEMRISDWSSDVCSSDLVIEGAAALADYDAIIIGAQTRFGRMPSQMAAFLDTAGGLWASGKLNGKVGGAFTSPATPHGGQELTLFSLIPKPLPFGLAGVGLDSGHAGQNGVQEVPGREEEGGGGNEW